MSKKLIQAAAGSAGEAVYVEDVFSTYLYEGNDSNGSTEQQIVNGLDLSTEGGMVWMKSRDGGRAHCLYDTERGNGYFLDSSTSAAQIQNTTSPVWRPTTTGFYTGRDYGGSENQNGESICSWSFRKQAGFFDVVTYTGDGSSTRNIAHDLGSAPGMIIVKITSHSDNWFVYHRSLNDNSGNPYFLQLNSTAAQDTGGGNFTTPSATHFGVRTNINTSGYTYVAYLFAHDDQSFGDNSDESIIKCGKFTEGTDVSVDLGFEPQWLLYKSATGTDSWRIIDNMRGVNAASSGSSAGDQKSLYPNLTIADQNESQLFFTPTGFFCDVAFVASTDIIYVAIRRPMKTPEAGTDVFGVNSYSETTDNQQLTTGNLADWGWQFLNGDGAKFFTRLLGKGYLNPTSDAVANTSAATEWDYMDGFAPYYAGTVSGFSPRQVLGFTRASGFFDVVAYNGNEVAGTSHNHNLGVTPEMMIVKSRSDAYDWVVWVNGFAITDVMQLNSTSAKFTNDMFDTLPTSSVFYVANNPVTNRAGSTYIAYLFATVDGVSKVGSYTGTGSNVDVNCGFSAGARFILIKRTDSTGDWYVWDSERGIVAGNDPYLLLNSTAAEVTSTDYIDPLSSGFTVTSSAPAALNASGGTYIFLAIS